MFNLFKKKQATEEKKTNRLDLSSLGAKVESPFRFPSFDQPDHAPSVTSDNGFIGLQSSPKTGLDWGFDAAQLGFFAASSYFIGYQACAMIATNWLVDKACNMPARDAVRNGYIVNCGSEDVAQKLRATDKRYSVVKNLRELIHFGRIYGGRIVLFNIASANPGEFYEAPFNIDGVQPGTYKGMSQIDPNWLEPVLGENSLNNPTSKDFYEPEYWRVKNRIYHKSHLHIFVPYPVPDFLKPTYHYMGVPVPQRILDRVYQAERSANESSQLLMTKRLVELKVNDTALTNRDALEANIQVWRAYRDNYGVKVSSEGESVTQHDTGLGDVDSVIMNQYQLVSAAANVPATKLLGTQPKGFNSSGEYEESVYREELESIQANDLSPLLERHYQLIAKSEGIPLTEEISIQWSPLDSPTAKEWAEIESIKAQRDAALFNTGAIDAEDIRNRLRQDREGDFHNIEEGVLNAEAIDPEADTVGEGASGLGVQGQASGLSTISGAAIPPDARKEN